MRYCGCFDTSIIDQPSSKEEELPSLQAVEESNVVDDPIDATVDNSVLTEHVTSHSVSTEPLVVRAMDKDESDLRYVSVCAFSGTFWPIKINKNDHFFYSYAVLKTTG